MRPALSIIFFTTLSGAGYGLWLLLGVLLASSNTLVMPKSAVLVMLAAGFVLTTIGLMFSVAHLGQPQRAWRAISQWRSSWLSREGIAAIVCMLVASLVAIMIAGDAAAVPIRIAAAVLAACALLVVYCTTRIYTSLPTIGEWHNPWVLPVYITLALETGSLWLWTLTGFAAPAVLEYTKSVPIGLTGVAVIVIALIAKLVYWRQIDHAPMRENSGSATGLDRIGEVRSFEHPHTEANYLTHEMGFVIARKHASRLRRLTLLMAFGIPLLLVMLSVLAPATALIAAPFALVSASLGAFVERWLFFAQARHLVMLYYGARSGAPGNVS